MAKNQCTCYSSLKDYLNTSAQTFCYTKSKTPGVGLESIPYTHGFAYYTYFYDVKGMGFEPATCIHGFIFFNFQLSC